MHLENEDCGLFCFRNSAGQLWNKEHTLWSLVYLGPFQARFTNNRGIYQGGDGLSEAVSYGHVP
jgi:hypothetical protein